MRVNLQVTTCHARNQERAFNKKFRDKVWCKYNKL